jgi:hypothetical protein
VLNVARLVVLLLFAIGWFQETLAVLFTWYALWNPLRFVVQRIRQGLRRKTTNTEDA